MPALPNRYLPWPATWRRPKISGRKTSRSTAAAAWRWQCRAAGPEGYGAAGGGTDPNAFQRRITLSRLTDLQTALNKVKPSLPAETQKKVDAVLAAMKPVITSASSKDTVDLRLAESIHTMVGAINKAVPGPAKPEADKTKEAVF